MSPLRPRKDESTTASSIYLPFEQSIQSPVLNHVSSKALNITEIGIDDVIFSEPHIVLLRELPAQQYPPRQYLSFTPLTKGSILVKWPIAQAFL